MVTLVLEQNIILWRKKQADLSAKKLSADEFDSLDLSMWTSHITDEVQLWCNIPFY